MKKNLFISVMCVLLLSACVKDGDFEALKHPINLQGTYDPQFGFPFLNVSTDMASILNMASTSFGKFTLYVNADSNRLAMKYHDSTEFNFDVSEQFNSTKTRRHYGRRKTVTLDSLIPGKVLFDKYWKIDSDMKFGEEISSSLGGMEFQNMYMTINFRLKSSINHYTEKLINRGFSVYLSEIECQLLYNGGRTLPVPIPENLDSVNILDMQRGVDFRLFEGMDMSNVLSSDLEKLEFCAHMKVQVSDPSRIIATANPSDTAFLYPDSCGIDSIHASLTMDADFTLQFYAEGFEMVDTTDLDLTNLDSMLAKVDKYLTIDTGSYLTFKATNSIPLAFHLDVRGMDVNKHALQDLNIIQGNNVINGAPMKLIAGGYENGSYESNGSSETRFIVPFSQQLLNDMRKTKHMRLGLTLATSTTGSPEAKPKVVVHGNDKLTLNAYITLSSQLNIDIPITK